MAARSLTHLKPSDISSALAMAVDARLPGSSASLAVHGRVEWVRGGGGLLADDAVAVMTYDGRLAHAIEHSWQSASTAALRDDVDSVLARFGLKASPLAPRTMVLLAL